MNSLTPVLKTNTSRGSAFTGSMAWDRAFMRRSEDLTEEADRLA